MKKRKLLYYSEFSNDAIGLDDSLVEGLIRKELRRWLDTIVVYYSRTEKTSRSIGDGLISIPYDQRDNLVEAVSEFVDVRALDFIVVRNTLAALHDALRNRRRFNYLVGFHPTFPHNLRRVHESDLAGKGRLRKRIEYRLKERRLNRLASMCDFIVSSSEYMIDDASLRRSMKFFKISNGVDLDQVLPYEPRHPHPDAPLRFVYIGSFDLARQLDVVFAAFDDLIDTSWNLTIFTPKPEEAEEIVRQSMPRVADRVEVLAAKPRGELFRRLADYDVGINLIPVNPVYTVSSPIKLFEYYACGLPAVMTPLPACLELFGDRNVGWITDFDRKAITRTLADVLRTDRAEILRLGAAGREIVLNERNYRKIGGEFAAFLEALD